MAVVPIRSGGLVPAVVAEPDAELVERLEELLDQAKSGHLRAIAYALIDRDKAVTTGWDGHADDHHMVAGINRLVFRYMSASLNADG